MIQERLNFFAKVANRDVRSLSSTKTKLSDVLNHHQPKKQQAFDEMQRLIDLGQMETEAYVEALADMNRHNEVCILAMHDYADLECDGFRLMPILRLILHWSQVAKPFR